jgi:hypothetical protein
MPDREQPILSDILVRAVYARTQREVLEGKLSIDQLPDLQQQPAIAKMVLIQLEQANEEERARFLTISLSIYRSMEALRGMDGKPQAKQPVLNDDLADFINVESGHKLDDNFRLDYLHTATYRKIAPSHWVSMYQQLSPLEKSGVQRTINRIEYDFPKDAAGRKIPIDWADPNSAAVVANIRDTSEYDLSGIRLVSPLMARFAKRSFKKL